MHYPRDPSVGGGQLTAPEDAAIYLINYNGHTALVDAGCGRALPRLLDNIRACGVDPDQIDYLLLTHSHLTTPGAPRPCGSSFTARSWPMPWRRPSWSRATIG